MLLPASSLTRYQILSLVRYLAYDTQFLRVVHQISADIVDFSQNHFVDEQSTITLSAWVVSNTQINSFDVSVRFATMAEQDTQIDTYMIIEIPCAQILITMPAGRTTFICDGHTIGKFRSIQDVLSAYLALEQDKYKAQISQ
jgi:hypothetical protein